MRLQVLGFTPGRIWMAGHWLPLSGDAEAMGRHLRAALHAAPPGRGDPAAVRRRAAEEVARRRPALEAAAAAYAAFRPSFAAADDRRAAATVRLFMPEEAEIGPRFLPMADADAAALGHFADEAARTALACRALASRDGAVERLTLLVTTDRTVGTDPVVAADGRSVLALAVGEDCRREIPVALARRADVPATASVAVTAEPCGGGYSVSRIAPGRPVAPPPSPYQDEAAARESREFWASRAVLATPEEVALAVERMGDAAAATDEDHARRLLRLAAEAQEGLRAFLAAAPA